MSNNNFVSPLDVLLVEDSPADVRLTKEAWRKRSAYEPSCRRDGEEAMQFFTKEGNLKKQSGPDLILLTWNSQKRRPRSTKRDKIGWKFKVNSHCGPDCLQGEEDVLKTYNLNANCYITKPIDLEQFSHV